MTKINVNLSVQPAKVGGAFQVLVARVDGRGNERDEQDWTEVIK